MPLQTLDSFGFNHKDQQDKLYESKTSTQVKEAFDSRGEDLQTKFNNAINVLKSTTAGDSGAENIGSSPIEGLTGNTIHEQILQMLNVAKQAQAGTILPGSVTDAQLSDDADQIKARFASHSAENASLTQVGHVQLQTTIDASETKALTPKALNNHQINYVRHSGYAVTSGTSTAYTITLDPAPTAYTDGQQFIINPHVDCGATPTLNVNGLGTGTIVKQDGSAISAGDIKANIPLSLVRVGSNFFIRSSGGSNIKSYQKFELTDAIFPNSQYNLTIAPVDPLKSIIRITAMSEGGKYIQCYGIFVNSTTISLKRSYTGTSALRNFVVEVYEYNNVKNKQDGVITSNVSSITIGSINPNKSIVQINFSSNGTALSDTSNGYLNYYLSNATTISLMNNISAPTFGWQVLEFN